MRHVLRGNILTRVLEAKTKGNIILPNDDKQIKAEVVVGGDQVNEGDIVYYAKNSPRPPVLLNIDNEDLWLVRENDILYIE